VLTNLVGNAVKFTSHGEVVVRVSREAEHDTNVVVRFEVTDTGIGIPAERQQMMFEAFEQADASTTRRYGGTGLGLAISKQLVELMGGRIGVTSEVGQGSTFWFTARFEKVTDSGESALPDPRQDLRGTLVLVVDDNATNRSVFSQMLANWGAEVDCVEDAASAEAKIRAVAADGRAYDVAILDQNMPDKSGLDLAAGLLDDGSTAALPLVLLTSSGQQESVQRARDLGVAGYLSKPVRQSQLYAALTTVLGRHAAEVRRAPMVTESSLRDAGARGKAHILVAEDNVVNQKVAARLLERGGYRVDVVADGQAAVDAVGRGQYDAVLMDCHMPVMDGFAATEEIRRREGTAHHIPILALTASATVDDRSRCLAAGMDDFVAKPVSADALFSTLRRWIDTGGTDGEPPNGKATTDERPEDIAGGDEEILDKNMLAGLRQLDPGGSQGLIAEIVQTFATDGRQRIDDLQDALAGNDADGVRSLAHALKGSAANLGVRVVRALSAELETIADTGSLEGVDGLVDRIDDEFERACAALRAESA